MCVPLQPEGPHGGSQAWVLAQSDPTELMRQTAQHESANTYGHRAPLRYLLRKISGQSDTTKEIVETAQGGVARLMAIKGRPLSPEQEQQEFIRLHTLIANPAIEDHRHRSELRDATRIEKFTRLLPEAFLYTFAGSQSTSQGEMIRLTFIPNPKFSPPDFESRILTGICGEVWIDPLELRVMHIEGRIFKTVDFGWGILGSVFPGGTLRIDQARTDICGWQLEQLRLHLHGKALLVKSLHIDVQETARNYSIVPASWSYQNAIRWLFTLPSLDKSAKL